MLQILRYPDAVRVTGLSRKSIERRIRAGTFPRPVKLGTRAVGFRSDHIEAWIRERPEACDG